MKTKKIMIALMLLTTGTAWAEDFPKDSLKIVDIEEVVVIATPKENRKLRDLPVAATVLSQDNMRANQVNSVKNLTGIVPNLFIPDYGSKLTTSIYIRGIGSRINTPSVGLYVDNIPYIDKSAFDFNYADIERIDILRGPQGTLYGRNTMGGLIKVHTKSPFTYQGTDIRMGAATYNNYNVSLTHYPVSYTHLFENHLMRGNRTTKMNAENFNAFRSFNYPVLAEAGIHIKYNNVQIHGNGEKRELKPHYLLDTNVVVLKLFPGIQENVIATILRIEGLKAVVLETYGSGNAPRKEWFIRRLCQASERGIVIVNVTQCSAGMVEMERYETGYQLLQAGVVSGYDSTTESAVTKLMFLLGHGYTPDEVRDRMNRSIAGEVTL